MTTLYDGTFDGLLTVAAQVRGHGALPEAIAREDHWQPSLFAEHMRIETDNAMAREISRALREECSHQVLRHVAYCWLSETPGCERSVVEYILLAFQLGARVEAYHAHPAVDAVHRLSRKVGGEIHRLSGLARFRELADGTLFAPVKPDYNVVCPLSLHFRRRMPAERWTICDMRRRTGVHWNGTTFDMVALDGEDNMVPDDIDDATSLLSSDERKYSGMWQTYFKTISISERKNPRLQRQYMPRRYWQYLVEQPGSSER